MLTYYAITNASALTLPPERAPLAAADSPSLGLVGCVVLAVTLPARASSPAPPCWPPAPSSAA